MVDPTPAPDSAMDTGSEDGEPGGTTDARPLTDDERAMLERLRHPSGHSSGHPSAPPPEESEAAGNAAEDDAPLADYPAPERPAAADPLDPVFREPTRD